MGNKTLNFILSGSCAVISLGCLSLYNWWATGIFAVLSVIWLVSGIKSR